MDDRLSGVVLDIVDEGVVCVNAGGLVTHFNRKAKEITGIVLKGGRSHPAGSIQPGDVVLIVDNMLGDDDGGMTPDILECIGVKDPELRLGDVVLAAGFYRAGGGKALYRRCGRNAAPYTLSLSGSIAGLDVVLTMDRCEKRLTVSVDGTEYYLRYLHSVAHLVVVDGQSREVKFYQEKGYSTRREALRPLLEGAAFQSKNLGTTEFSIIGRDFFEVFEPCELTRRMDRLLTGESGITLDEDLYINQRLVSCSILPVLESGQVQGAVLKFTDLSEMHQLLQQRNDLITKIERANLALESRTTRVPITAFPNFSGSSPAIQRVKYLAFKAAQSQSNIIITGESGTGKSQLAQEIHRLCRPGGPFVEVNCGSIPRDLFESELFGYTGGAFTGALPGGKPGYFEQANGGTIFLDEIGEIPMSTQVKLLYAIQNKRFYRVGATKPTDVDVRILSATNQDLWKAVQKGRFREDLYYRIHVFHLHIPPLRERISDLYLLSRSLTEDICSQYGTAPKKLSGAAVEKLLRYDWPGNIRELRNVVERAVAVSETSIIGEEDIPAARFGVSKAVRFLEAA